VTADTRAREAFEALHPKVVFDWEDGYPIPRGVFPHDCYFDKWDGFALATAAEREQRDGEPLIDYKLRTDDDYRRKFINELHKQVDAERERVEALPCYYEWDSGNEGGCANNPTFPTCPRCALRTDEGDAT